MKPNQQISGIQPHSLNTLDDRISFSLDSVLEPSLSSHLDIDLFSQGHITSQLSGFPKYPKMQKFRQDSGKIRHSEMRVGPVPRFPSSI